jgi:hypothetical protein
MPNKRARFTKIADSESKHSLYENQEGDFAYTIRRRTFRGGKTVWRWEVRRRISLRGLRHFPALA